MHLTQDHQKRVNTLHRTMEAWASAHGQDRASTLMWFHRDSPLLAEWVQHYLVDSLLEGDTGVEACITSIENEHDETLKHMKFFSTLLFWPTLEANPEELAIDLKEQGWTQTMLGTMLKERILTPVPSVNGVDYEDARLDTTSDSYSPSVLFH